jgi:hypothetical protein
VGYVLTNQSLINLQETLPRSTRLAEEVDSSIDASEPIPVAVWSKNLGVRQLASWNSGFESRRRHGYLCLVSVVCCQVEVPASS